MNERLITDIPKPVAPKREVNDNAPFFVCTVGGYHSAYTTVFLQLLAENPFLGVDILLTPEQAEQLAQELITAAASARRNEPYGSGDKPQTAT